MPHLVNFQVGIQESIYPNAGISTGHLSWFAANERTKNTLLMQTSRETLSTTSYLGAYSPVENWFVKTTGKRNGGGGLTGVVFSSA